MKTVSILLCLLVSLLLLINFCSATDENVADFHPGQGGDVAKNGGEDQEEKFKYLHHHHKSFFKKPFFKPIPHKYPFLKKPIPHHPLLKKPYHPPVFPSHP